MRRPGVSVRQLVVSIRQAAAGYDAPPGLATVCRTAIQLVLSIRRAVAAIAGPPLDTTARRIDPQAVVWIRRADLSIGRTRSGSARTKKRGRAGARPRGRPAFRKATSQRGWTARRRGRRRGVRRRRGGEGRESFARIVDYIERGQTIGDHMSLLEVKRGSAGLVTSIIDESGWADVATAWVGTALICMEGLRQARARVEKNVTARCVGTALICMEGLRRGLRSSAGELGAELHRNCPYLYGRIETSRCSERWDCTCGSRVGTALICMEGLKPLDVDALVAGFCSRPVGTALICMEGLRHSLQEFALDRICCRWNCPDLYGGIET